MNPSSSPFDLLQWTNTSLRQEFEGVAQRRLYEAGQVIYLQGDSAREMYRIVSGSVRLSVARSDGREAVYLRFEPGDCFGEASLIDDDPRAHTAEAVSDVELQVLDIASFRRLRNERRDFDEALLRLLSRQMRFASNLYMELSLHDLPGRIARRVLEAARTAGVPSDATYPVKLPLSQSEIAAMVSASRQTVNRVLQQMQAEGVIATEYSGIVVTDMERLRDLTTRG